jgi:hypothetical protein
MRDNTRIKKPLLNLSEHKLYSKCHSQPCPLGPRRTNLTTNQHHIEQSNTNTPLCRSPPERTPLSANHPISNNWMHQPTSQHTPKAIALAISYDVINSQSSPVTHEVSPNTHKTHPHSPPHYITSSTYYPFETSTPVSPDKHPKTSNPINHCPHPTHLDHHIPIHTTITHITRTSIPAPCTQADANSPLPHITHAHLRS